ncbi:glycosyltransferase family 2 protein [Micromonospora chersina]|uniref:glycosyltransferase family 2 protein n=1 Tax=Micromonospora chersina TaxID=47854 RepID=UPI00372082D0
MEEAMRTVSVLTPVHKVTNAFLSDAYGSLVSQEMPVGWQWQWIVQEDGQSGEVAAVLPDDPRIITGTGRHGGPGVARTLALSSATGELVKVLDADDRLTAGALRRDIEAFDRHPSVGWATSAVLDILLDGATLRFNADPPEGIIEKGEVFERWVSNNYQANIHPATLCIRRNLLLALGGWMALPASEDMGLLMALNVVSLGYFTAEPGLLYRKWPGQMTVQPSHRESVEQSARHRIVEARARALLEMGVLVARNDAA